MGGRGGGGGGGLLEPGTDETGTLGKYRRLTTAGHTVEHERVCSGMG